MDDKSIWPASTELESPSVARVRADRADELEEEMLRLNNLDDDESQVKKAYGTHSRYWT
jgi:hypothetical protein